MTNRTTKPIPELPESANESRKNSIKPGAVRVQEIMVHSDLHTKTLHFVLKSKTEEAKKKAAKVGGGLGGDWVLWDENKGKAHKNSSRHRVLFSVTLTAFWRGVGGNVSPLHFHHSVSCHF